MEQISLPCKRCSVPVSILSEVSALAKHGVYCDDCQDTERQESIAAQHRRLMNNKWTAICPAAYQDTRLDLLPCPDLTARAMQWPGDDATRGLNLWGFPRTGKTRTLMLILHRAHFAGKSVLFVGPNGFIQGCEQRQYTTAPWIKRLEKLDVLAFDDIDKAKMAGHQEEKFFALLDARFRLKRPTFYTGNATGDELKTKFRNGEAIVARIREHSTSIHFAQQKNLGL